MGLLFRGCKQCRPDQSWAALHVNLVLKSFSCFDPHDLQLWNACDMAHLMRKLSDRAFSSTLPLQAASGKLEWLFEHSEAVHDCELQHICSKRGCKEALCVTRRLKFFLQILHMPTTKTPITIPIIIIVVIVVVVIYNWLFSTVGASCFSINSRNFIPASAQSILSHATFLYHQWFNCHWHCQLNRKIVATCLLNLSS